MGHCPRLDLKGQRQQFISSCPDSTGTEGAAPHTWHPPSPSPQPPHHRLCHHHDRFPGVLVAVSPPPRPPLSSRPKRTRTGMRHPCISDRRAARGRLDLGTWYTMGLPKAQGQRSIYRLTVCVYRAYCSTLQATSKVSMCAFQRSAVDRVACRFCLKRLSLGPLDARPGTGCARGVLPWCVDMYGCASGPPQAKKSPRELLFGFFFGFFL